MSYDAHTTSRPANNGSSPSSHNKNGNGSVGFTSASSGGASSASPQAGGVSGGGVDVSGGVSVPQHGSPQPLPPPPPPPTIHKRTYQACIPCRQRKVRCDLGSVEAPHDPPCVRCRRESKECYFSATRRKTRTPSGSGDDLVGVGRGRGLMRGVIRKREDEADSDGAGPLKRARSIGHGSPLEETPRPDSATYPPSDYTRGHHRSPTYSPYSQQQSYQTQIDPRLQTSIHTQPRHDDERETAITTDTLLQTPVHNSHEALLTLIEAAGKDTPLSSGSKSTCADSDTDGEGDDTTCRGGSGEDRCQPNMVNNHSEQHTHSPVSHTIHTAGRNGGTGVRFSSIASPPDQPAGSSFASSHARRRAGSTSTMSPGMRPHIRNMSISTIQDPKEREAMEKSIRAWNKFRFVKAGWFTAREAIAYVEYFYRHLHPLSPTLTSPSLQHITHPIHHPLLLKHEPFLTTIILLITSRYLILPTAGGLSRSYAIHDMLWREVRGGCEGLMWGGGWGSLGTPHAGGMSSGMASGLGNANGTSKVSRGLRTLGTVEGLLILTEWHVRGLHFPMDVEEGDWMVDVSSDEEHPHPHPGRTRKTRPTKSTVVEGLGDRIENILEPAYRSDRMSWMLLGNALALAYELGVFDEIDEPTPPGPPTDPPATDGAIRLRFARIQKLLLVYVLQLASRLGWTSMIPRHITQAVRHKLNSQAPSPASLSSAPHSASSGRPSTRWESEDELQDVIFNSWVDLTMLMKSSAEKLFPSRSVTKNIMRSGEYVQQLEYFRPLLREWKRDFEGLRLPEPIMLILTMEYEHVRFYINSLALQAVVDRCTFSPSGKSSEVNGNGPTSNGANGNGSGKNFAAALQSSQDAEFIKEVVDASRALLSCVVEKMWPGGYLKHAPVRIYLRILSASMFLLKTFALGAPKEEVILSISLINKTVEALRSASVDDVHLGLRFADLLETLTKRINLRFVQVGRGSRAGTPVPSSSTPGASGLWNRSMAGIDVTVPRTPDADAGGYGLGVKTDPNIGMPPPPTPTLQRGLLAPVGSSGYDNNYTHSPGLPGSVSNGLGGISVGTESNVRGEGPGTPYAGGEVPADDPNFFFAGYEDWLALPIDPIVGAGFGGVTSGQMGPDVGGVDLLELLLAGGGG